MPDMGQNGMPPPDPMAPDIGPYSPFEAAIPGESLTREPGNSPWERPPQFPSAQTAAEFLFQQILKPATLKGILTMLKMGVPAEALAKVLLFTGFSEGKWTPDVAGLLLQPVVAMIVGLGGRAEIKDMKIVTGDKSSDKIVRQIMKQMHKDKMPAEGKTPQALVQALVAKPESMNGV